MIPIGVPSLFFVILVYLLPVLAGFLLAGTIVFYLYRRLRLALNPDTPALTAAVRRRLRIFLAITAALNIWAGYVYYTGYTIYLSVMTQQANKEKRRHFVLQQDYQYGELNVPKGSVIDRYDAFDNGEDTLPVSLRGLRTVSFPHPVTVAGAKARALDATSGIVELAEAQTLGPLYIMDEKGDYIRDTVHNAKECKEGQLASFNIPLIDYDIRAEFAKPSPDGPDARFRPSQWQLTGCEDGPPIAPAPN